MPVYEQPSPIKRPIGQVIPHVNVVPERRRIFISTEGGIPRTVSTIASGPYTIQGSPIIRRLPVGKTTVITQRPMFVETPPVANTVTVETSSSPVKTVRWEKTPSYYPSPANFNRGLGETVPMDENQSHGPVVVKTKESPKKVVEKSDEVGVEGVTAKFFSRRKRREKIRSHPLQNLQRKHPKLKNPKTPIPHQKPQNSQKQRNAVGRTQLNRKQMNPLQKKKKTRSSCSNGSVLNTPTALEAVAINRPRTSSSARSVRPSMSLASG